MDLINRVCETQIKLETSQFWPIFTMVTFVYSSSAPGSTRSSSRGTIGFTPSREASTTRSLVGKDPVHKSEKVEGKFERFYLLFMIVKFIGIIIVSHARGVLVLHPDLRQHLGARR